MTAVARGCLAGIFALSLAATSLAQEAKSSALARELAAALDAAKLDSIAAADPTAPDRFIAALYYPGTQLLVAAAQYSAPSLLTEKIQSKNYRDVYIDLNSASVPDSKVLVQDAACDGLQKKAVGLADSYDNGKAITFDGDWKGQKLTSEDSYNEAFSKADAAYSQMLSALLAELKKTS